MLAITRRPSATTPGSVANLPSSSTSCATARVAAAPEPMATPMSASLSASASFTPSPVIATTWPRRLQRADHRPLLLRGDPAEHRVLLEHVGQRVLVLGQLAGVDRLRRRRGRRVAATAPTVRGLSPEMTLQRDALLRGSRRSVSAASGRTFSANSTSATGVEVGRAASSPSSGPSLRASRSVRRPSAASSSATPAHRTAARRSSTISGAPITQVPWPSNVAALHLRADENGTPPVRVQPGGR